MWGVHSSSKGGGGKTQMGPKRVSIRAHPGQHLKKYDGRAGWQEDGAVSASSRQTTTAGLRNREVLSSTGSYKRQVAYWQDQYQPMMCPSRGKFPGLT